jgi:hypothetical protein
VVGIAYDKKNNKIELTIKNDADAGYNVKSTLRLVQPAPELAREIAESDGIPMSAAQARAPGKNSYQLLCEDDNPIFLKPNEEKTLSYDILVPQDLVKLDDSKNVEVQITYGDEGPSRQTSRLPEKPNPKASSILTQAQEADFEASLLEDLLAVLESPDTQEVFEADDVSDISSWISTVVGDKELSAKIAAVDVKDTVSALNEIAAIVGEKAQSLKHPHLRRVNESHSFILKKSHEEILGQISHLEELAEAVCQSQHDAILFHTQAGNDFANWIEHAVGDAELAQSIREATSPLEGPEKTKTKTASLILERVDWLKCANQ